MDDAYSSATGRGSGFAVLPRESAQRFCATFRASKAEFLPAAEQAAGSLQQATTGRCWTFDGYKSDTLFLRLPHSPSLGDLDLVVTFDLELRQESVQVSVRSASKPVIDLFRRFTAQLSLLLPLEC